MQTHPKLEHPNTHYLSAAEGWIELGNAEEAKVELALINPAFQGHPDVLEVSWRVCVEENRWEDALQNARRLIECAPTRPSGWLHQAYALRRVASGSLQLAWDALLPASERFPQEPIIAYNLSCYACQMQELDAARAWFRRAFELGNKASIRAMALADPDLEPLWLEIQKLGDQLDETR
jgi:Flp pilus assembly protein TadD